MVELREGARPMAEVDEWLERLGLGGYAQLFADNDIDLDVVSDLTDEDLKQLGISLGHRKRLLRAIAELARAAPATTASAPDRAPEGVAATEPAADPERRQLTVVFCDLVGSTALAARLDLEDMREVIRAYQACCVEVVRGFDGHVAKFIGDGVLAYFGYPSAHEDDAERAVRAGLALTEALGRMSAGDTPLAARVGIATGRVVVGEKDVVVGETPNLAARLQTLADPGGVVIARSTRRLIGEWFDLIDLGEHQLKGFADPVPAWRVLSESGAEGRFEC